MAKKKGNFFEQNIEKIVLSVSGLLSLWLLWLFVLSLPHHIEIDGQSKSPGSIDPYINGRADMLPPMNPVPGGSDDLRHVGPHPVEARPSERPPVSRPEHRDPAGLRLEPEL